MIGSLRAGTMQDNSHEGHSGAVIDEIAAFTSAYRERPNVILVHAGTNDINQGLNLESAPLRVDALVEKLLTACPDATIIVARIIPSGRIATAGLVPPFNTAVAALMSTRIQKGQHIVIADLFSAVQAADLPDKTHPNDFGYNKMAVSWGNAKSSADSMGWIRDPLVDQGQIATGFGLGSNIWLSESCSLNKQSGTCECQSGYVPITPVLLNSTQKCGILMLKSPTTTAVHFADIDGDGRADYLYINKTGAVAAFLNVGEGNNISWLPQGQIATAVGGDRGNIHLADINGDGRADYLWVHNNGSVDCWLNMGLKAGKVTWHKKQTIAVGFGNDGAGVRFADLNGDGRAEYIYVNSNISVVVWLNEGSPGGVANSAIVSWLAQGVIAVGVPGMGRDNVVFADMNGDQKADYLAVSRTDGSVRLWLNGGESDNGAKVGWLPHGSIAAGVGTNGRGVQFADLTGDGRAEYLDVGYNTSAVHAWMSSC
ncbi:hypothetical protein HYALB_00005599 [Hymenoscyphus albidus]|uniref:SGNH hydrolase-type esterase domain-containing protein n=1 Tax=Hymenoscyphus albidus TaxID=595503 RepID=A0A9N9LGZ1_9HELO|nr:hypothetical protein HYALB_00005599 [Hymenoscyphus albidus]